jgi:hypothetical protein
MIPSTGSLNLAAFNPAHRPPASRNNDQIPGRLRLIMSAIDNLSRMFAVASRTNVMVRRTSQFWTLLQSLQGL